jgi:hypothetical protein
LNASYPHHQHHHQRPISAASSCEYDYAPSRTPWVIRASEGSSQDDPEGERQYDSSVVATTVTGPRTNGGDCSTIEMDATSASCSFMVSLCNP